jgi:hypothetical protein
MGSGISLNKTQIIHIIQREINAELKLKLDNKRLFDDSGFPIIETFDEEEEHLKMTKFLQIELLRFKNE